MMDPAMQLLTDYYVRRSNADAALHRAELSEARNRLLGVGPEPTAFSPAYVLRAMKPGRDRLNDALAQLADPAYRRDKARARAAATRTTPTASTSTTGTKRTTFKVPIDGTATPTLHVVVDKHGRAEGWVTT